MSSYRRALKRARAERAAEHYRSLRPLRKVRVGEQVRVRAGEVLTVVVDVDGVEQVRGHVQAGDSGVFTLSEQAARQAAAAQQ